MNYIKSKAVNFQGEVNQIATFLNVEKRKESYKKIEVFYAYEPLCGWCYGFSSELNKLIRRLAPVVDFKLINGGIFAGNKSLKMESISEHIKNNMGHVTERSGIEFGEKFINLLEDKNYRYDSKKASIAVSIIRDLFPEKTFEFAANIQKAFFYHGKDIQADSFYVELLKPYPINLTHFLERLNSDIEAIKIEYEFQNTERIGFKGYPATAIRVKNKTSFLNQGFTTASQLTSKIFYVVENSVTA